MRGKSNQTSSRKIYIVCCHYVFIITVNLAIQMGDIAINESKSSSEKSGSLQNKKHPQRRSKRKSHATFIIFMVFLSFVMSVIFSYSSSTALEHADILTAFIILLCFILIGIFFDVIGIATTSCDEKAFHSMAARKVSGAKEGIWLLKNAEKVASICNDVVGDICGIISGSTGAAISAMLITSTPVNKIVVPLVITGIIASLTIGGKAFGKTIAINKSKSVVFSAAKIIYFFKKLFGRGA